MVEIGDYSIRDIMALIIPVVINGIYKTEITYKGEYLRIKVMVEKYKNGNVFVKKLSMRTNMNGGTVRQWHKTTERYVLPIDIFNKYYRYVF